MSFILDFVPLLLVIVAISFIFELMDATLGLGFGTVFTPVLLILNFETSIIVPSILLTELFAGLIAMVFHYLLKNVRLGKKRKFRKRKRKKLVSEEMLETDFEPEEEFDSNDEIILEEDDEVIEVDNDIEEITHENETFLDRLRNLTTDSKVILILAIFGALGVFLAALLNVIFDYNEYFNFGVKIYIGLMVLVMGILMLAFRNFETNLTLKKIIGLGAIAGFNKGISGGGYRPVSVAGQILAGRNGRNALASTTFSKTIVSLIGILTYIVSHLIETSNSGLSVNWDYLGLAPYLLAGAAIAAPIGAFITKKVESKWLKIAISWATIGLGIFSLIHTILIFTGVWNKIIIFVGLDTLLML